MTSQQFCPMISGTSLNCHPYQLSATNALDSHRLALDNSRMFRPCIDLHEGKVKQIVGGSLGPDPARLQTNFVSDRPASWYAELYRRDDLPGGHVIQLGPGNEAAAREALRAYPGGL